MKSIVIDSSVLLATAFVENHSRQAANLLSRRIDEGYSLHAPPLVYYEVVNVIRKAVYFNRIIEEEGRRFEYRLLATPIETHFSIGLVNRAYELARDLNLPRTYDMQYLAVAEFLDCAFWTADQRLFNSARDAFPSIHWLGTYEE